MDLKKIKQFINLAKEEGVTELKYESSDEEYFVSFKKEVVATREHTQVPVRAAATQPTAVEQKTTQADHSLHLVKAPFVGTFYASPGPGEAVYTAVGAKVGKGKTLCIIEAMKIMNEIESDVSGEVVEICVDNESFVEYGQVLFKIKKG